jgi:hypothetical protein
MKSQVALLALCCLASVHAAEPWGHSPEAGDDRFSNPKKPLYAGPDGWWNMGEVRAEVNNTAKTAYAYKGSFTLVSNQFVSVGGPAKLQTVLFDFVENGVPAPGDYKVTTQGSLKNKTVRISFADTSASKISEWTPTENSGVLTVKVVHGFLYLTCRDLKLQAVPSPMANHDVANSIMTFGFEGAMSPSEVGSYEKQ